MQRRGASRFALCLTLLLIGGTSATESARGNEAPAALCGCEGPIPIVTVEPVVSPRVYSGGTVVTRVVVDERGGVERVEVLSPYPALVDPVVKAVKQWRFAPATRAGRPVPGSAIVAVQVNLLRTVVGRRR